jgi:hypothetical protein
MKLGLRYFDVLSFIHAWMKPSCYVEIGVGHGESLTLARPGTSVVAVDPKLEIAYPVGHLSILEAKMTSDDFFISADAEHYFAQHVVDLALIDGMHQFEFALRDFINLEARAHASAMIVLHDTLPIGAAMAARHQRTPLWTGDVWKTAVALKTYRPDLTITTLDVAPTGLTLVTGLNPRSTALSDALPQILRAMSVLSYADFQLLKTSHLNVTRARPQRVVDLTVSVDGVVDTEGVEAFKRLDRAYKFERLFLLKHVRRAYWRLRGLRAAVQRL